MCRTLWTSQFCRNAPIYEAADYEWTYLWATEWGVFLFSLLNIKEPPLHTCACLHTYKSRARAQHTARVIIKAPIRTTQLPRFSGRGHRVQAHQHFLKCWNHGGQIKQEKYMKANTEESQRFWILMDN